MATNQGASGTEYSFRMRAAAVALRYAAPYSNAMSAFAAQAEGRWSRRRAHSVANDPLRTSGLPASDGIVSCSAQQRPNMRGEHRFPDWLPDKLDVRIEPAMMQALREDAWRPPNRPLFERKAALSTFSPVRSRSIVSVLWHKRHRLKRLSTANLRETARRAA